jgi:HAD superfamily hydrolase (TIGR01509 family)
LASNFTSYTKGIREIRITSQFDTKNIPADFGKIAPGLASGKIQRFSFSKGKTMLKALIFDFDGLILDTETPEYETWRAIYHEFSQDLSIETWGQIVGGSGASDFNPLSQLESLTGRDLASLHLSRRVSEQSLARIHSQPPLPGVLDLLNAARAAELRLAIASSSTREWVEGHLTRLGLLDRFEALRCREDVEKTKPEPDLFLSALDALGVSPQEACAFEDSPNGVLAARRAGIPVVAVPNPITARLNIHGETLRLKSLADFDLHELLMRKSA